MDHVLCAVPENTKASRIRPAKPSDIVNSLELQNTEDKITTDIFNLFKEIKAWKDEQEMRDYKNKTK